MSPLASGVALETLRDMLRVVPHCSTFIRRCSNDAQPVRWDTLQLQHRSGASGDSHASMAGPSVSTTGTVAACFVLHPLDLGVAFPSHVRVDISFLNSCRPPFIALFSILYIDYSVREGHYIRPISN